MGAMMSGLPTVSVIIPTYNRASLVSAAVKSVMAQTHSELEIIIVDDGSSDGTEQMLRSFVEGSGGRISYIRQDNQGVSAARNNGVALARGEWIAFLDSDDVWLPEKLEWQIRALRQFGGRCGACYTNARFVYGADNKPTVFVVSGVLHREVIGVLTDATRLIVTPRRTMPIWLQTLIVRAELVRRAGGFDPQLRFGEDEDCVFRLACLTNFCFVNIPLVDIARAPARERHIGPSEMWDRFDFRLRQVQYRWDKWLDLSTDLPQDVRRLILRNLRSVHSGWANWYLWNEDYENARRAISRAARCDMTPGIALKWILTRVSPRLALRILALREGKRGDPSRVAW